MAILCRMSLTLLIMVALIVCENEFIIVCPGQDPAWSTVVEYRAGNSNSCIEPTRVAGLSNTDTVYVTHQTKCLGMHSWGVTIHMLL